MKSICELTHLRLSSGSAKTVMCRYSIACGISFLWRSIKQLQYKYKYGTMECECGFIYVLNYRMSIPVYKIEDKTIEFYFMIMLYDVFCFFECFVKQILIFSVNHHK